MGTILEGACGNCGYHARLLTGNGLRDCDPKTALEAFPRNMGLAAALGTHGRFQIQRHPAMCVRCHKLLAPPQVTYWDRDNVEHRLPPVCPTCGGAVRQREKNLLCPMCGGPIELLPAGHWD